MGIRLTAGCVSGIEMIGIASNRRGKRGCAPARKAFADA
jgi:hypothetical protein